MPFKQGRNDYCFCDSGIKYKRCCLPLTYINDIDGINITDEPLSFDEFQDGREAVAPHHMDRLEVLLRMLTSLASSAHTLPSDFFNELQQLHHTYPNHPTIINYLYNGYTIIGEHAIARSFLATLTGQFPLYIFGRVINAHLCLRADQFEQAFAFLGQCNSLKELAPYRTQFHVGEGIVFHEALTEYYLKTDQQSFVERHYRNLVKLASITTSNEYNTRIETLRERIRIARLIHIVDTFKALQVRL